MAGKRFSPQETKCGPTELVRGAYGTLEMGEPTT